jgi:hypothetical protein
VSCANEGRVSAFIHLSIMVILDVMYIICLIYITLGCYIILQWFTVSNRFIYSSLNRHMSILCVRWSVTMERFGVGEGTIIKLYHDR